MTHPSELSIFVLYQIQPLFTLVMIHFVNSSQIPEAKRLICLFYGVT